jgi:hypothetical protein
MLLGVTAFVRNCHRICLRLVVGWVGRSFERVTTYYEENDNKTILNKFVSQSLNAILYKIILKCQTVMVAKQ